MSRPDTLTAIYPGSFDPITKGHEDIVRRSLKMVDRLIVAVAHTSTQQKSGLFAVEERVDLIRSVFANDDRVDVLSFEGLLVKFARGHDATIVIRGLRAVSDFEYELQMAQMNQELWPDIQTIFLAPEVDYSFLSSSLVREVASLGGDVSRFVSAPVLTALRGKLGQ